MSKVLDLFGRPASTDNGARQALDYYETPQWMVASLLANHPILRSDLHVGPFVFEPCVGDGAIARVLEKAGTATVITNDLDVHHAAMMHGDATHADLWRHSLLVDIDWVITNPPFNVAIDILQHAVEHARIGVAMLLRKTFREPTKERGTWLAAHPPTHEIGLPRHKFRREAKGTDSVSADWMIWRRDGYVDRPFIVDHEAKSRRVGA